MHTTLLTQAATLPPTNYPQSLLTCIHKAEKVCEPVPPTEAPNLKLCYLLIQGFKYVQYYLIVVQWCICTLSSVHQHWVSEGMVTLNCDYRTVGREFLSRIFLCIICRCVNVMIFSSIRQSYVPVVVNMLPVCNVLLMTSVVLLYKFVPTL